MKCRLTLLVLVLGSATAYGQSAGLSDPTRPPDVVGQAATDGPTAAPTGPQLQMVMSRQGARPRALISGEWVEQGGVYGAFRVVKVLAESAILEGASGRETLRLTPQVALQRPKVAQAGGTGSGVAKKNKPAASNSAVRQTNGSTR